MKYRLCETCGQPMIGMTVSDWDLLAMLTNDSAAYVYQRRDGMGWKITGSGGHMFPDFQITRLREAGEIVPRWPGSEAGEGALTVPRHAMTYDVVTARLAKMKRQRRVPA